MITVWSFDDLWEEGYRFDDVVTKRYCFVDRKFAKNENEALEFLESAYRFIPKIQGNSRPLANSEQITGKTLTVVIRDNAL